MFLYLTESAHYRFGRGRGPILFKECIGYQQQMLRDECLSRNNSHCSHEDDVGVRCLPGRASEHTVALVIDYGFACSNLP